MTLVLAAVLTGITCGHHSRREGVVKHDSIEAVRACSQGRELFKCTWLIDHGLMPEADSAYDRIILPCDADAWETSRGWECSAGHDYVDIATRHVEKWDYCHDEEEAKQMRKAGFQGVSMDGKRVL